MSDTVYSEKLKDPRWQRKRLQVFERDNWTCLSCNRTDRTLHIHHLKYSPGLEPWEYDLSLLVTYCELCHNTEHLIGEELNNSLLDIIRNNRLLIKPVAELCILAEKWSEFPGKLKSFITESMISYLKTLNPLTNGSGLDKVA